MVDVVVAYSPEDQLLVQPIVEQLEALGLEVQRAPQPEDGTENSEGTGKQTDDFGALLVCWTSHAVDSEDARAAAQAAFGQGKLVACRLKPCLIPAPLDSVHVEELENWTGEADAPQWGKVVAAVAEKLRRPRIAELWRARASGDERALGSVPEKLPDEQEAQRVWENREAELREECASILRDARRYLEQRAASQQAKIETALKSFERDFENWIERERRGESSPKPSLSTLFDIWLERRPRGQETSKQNVVSEQGSETVEVETAASQQKRENQTAELKGRAEAAARSAERAKADLARARQELETLKAATAELARRPARSRRILSILAAAAGAFGLGVAAFGVGMLAGNFVRLEHEPAASTAAALEKELSSGLKDERRQAVVDVVAREAGDDMLKILLETAPETVARASASKTPALAVSEALRASASQAVAPVANLPAGELVRGLVANMSSEKLAQVREEIAAAAGESEGANGSLAGRKRSSSSEEDRSATLVRLVEQAPEEAARVLASRAPAVAVAEALKASRPQAMAPLAQMPPRDLFKALEASIPSARMAELGKLFSAALPQRVAAYKSFENLDVESSESVRLNNIDLQNCASACRQKESCKAYTFDKWNHACYLKANVGNFRLNPRSVTGIREDVRTPKAPSGEVRMERYPLKAFPGSGYRSFEAEGPAACEQVCKNEDVCVAYTFQADQGKCRLFSSAGEYFGNELADSGGKRRD